MADAKFRFGSALVFLGLAIGIGVVSGLVAWGWGLMAGLKVAWAILKVAWAILGLMAAALAVAVGITIATESDDA